MHKEPAVFKKKYLWKCSPQENVVDLLAYESPQSQELAVDAVEDGLQEVPLPWVFAVEQIQELEKEREVERDKRER